jgi:hypothetical protein
MNCISTRGKLQAAALAAFTLALQANGGDVDCVQAGRDAAGDRGSGAELEHRRAEAQQATQHLRRVGDEGRQVKCGIAVDREALQLMLSLR